MMAKRKLSRKRKVARRTPAFAMHPTIIYVALTSTLVVILFLSSMLGGVNIFKGSKASAVSCTQTGFMRDGINMTAALINPSSVVKGTIDATGCNIGVYFDQNGSVANATIHGANYFGIVVNGDVKTPTVDVTNTNIHDIGETPLNGTQHGVGIYYRSFGSGSTSGRISNNLLTNYQKGGIVTNGKGTSVDITGNTVVGQGAVTYIAQNGIQVGYGAVAKVMKNIVTGNSYSGTNNAASGGIIAVGGPCYGGVYTTDTQIVGNLVKGNDVGIWLSNIQSDCLSAPTSQTNIKVIDNVISSDSYNNVSGNNYPDGYQAGISDQGDNDKLINNDISGAGYDPANATATTFRTWIDALAAFTNKAKIHANKFQ